MTRERFTELVEEALREIPARFRREMRNVAVVVEHEPSPEVLEDVEAEPGDTLFGLYQGTPLPDRGWSYGNTLPDRISIYQGPIEEDCDSPAEMADLVRDVVIHEVGHYFGLDDETMDGIEHED